MSTQITTQKILAFDNYADFPGTGLDGYIYIDNSANIAYLWDSISITYVSIGGANTPAAQVVLFADLATTEALKACTYNNGTSGVGATLTGNANGQLSTVSFTGKIDNTTTVLGQIILVKNQSSQLQNGLYLVTQLGNGSTPFILTRTTDADTQEELYPVQINVFGGATNANIAYLQKTADPIIGTSAIKFDSTPIGITNTPLMHVDTVTSAALPSCNYTSGTNATIPGNGAYLQASSNGALGTINGITLAVGNRILVKDQVNQAHNGTYTVAVVGNGSTPWKLVRVDAWGSNFVRLQREWKVNNSASTKFGARYSTNLSSLANTAVGTTALVFNEVQTSTGIFGISNSSGTYTYYSTLTAAMTAASSGQTIEVFADYTENTGVTITLKDGVNINGNGHTYTFVGTSPGQNTFVIANNSTVNSSITNYIITSSNSSGGNCIYLGTNLTGKLILTSSVFKITGASSMNIISNFATSNIDIINLVAYSSSSGILLASSPTARIVNAYVNSSGIAYSGNAYVNNSEFISSNNIAIYNNSGTINNCIGTASANYGIQSIGGILNDCRGYSTSSNGIYILYSNAYNCFGYSTASYGIYFTNQPCRGYNCLGYSASNNGIRMYYIGLNSDLQLYDSTAISSVATAFYWENFASNITCISGTTHAAEGTNNAVITNSTLVAGSAGANCLYKASAISQSYSHCTFKGATTPVNANITQTANLEDLYGNIIV